MAEVRKHCKLLKRYLRSENCVKAGQSIADLVPALRAFVRETKTSQKPDCKRIIKGFRMISKFVRSQCMISRSGVAIDPHLCSEIRETVEEATEVQGNDVYFMNLWKRTVVISTFLMNSSVVTSWDRPVCKCFLAGLHGSDPMSSPMGLIARFHYLMENLRIRPASMQWVWWELISTELFSMFVQYPVVGLDGGVVEKKCGESKCPQVLSDDMAKLFSNPDFQAYCVLKRDSPNEITALLYWLIKTDPGTTDAILEWFMHLWRPIADKGYEKTEAFGLMQVYAAVLPQGLVNLVQLMTRYVARKIEVAKSGQKQKQSKVDFSGFSVLQVIWNGALRAVADEALLEKILFSVVLELEDVLPLMETSTFLAFTFNLKMTSASVWDFFASRLNGGEGDSLVICETYMAIFAVTLAPLLFDFTYERLIEVLKEKVERGQRLRYNVAELQHQLDMLGSRHDFVRFITNDAELEKAYTTLEADGKLIFYDLAGGDWQLSVIPEYLNALWKSCGEQFYAKLACRFFSALSVVQRFVPQGLMHRPKDQVSPLYVPTLRFLIDGAYNVPLLKSCITSLGLLGLHQDIGPTQFLWIEVVMKYLWAKDPSVQKAILPIAVQVMQQLGGESFCLMPFLAEFLEQKSICLSQTEQSSFSASAYAVVKSRSNYDVPSCIVEDLHGLAGKEETEGRKFAGCYLRTIESNSRKDTGTACLEELQKHQNGSFPGNEFMTVFLEEMVSDSAAMPHWLMEEIGDVLTDSKFRGPMVRLLSFLSRHISQLKGKMLKFWPKIGTVFMSALEDVSFHEQALIVETIMAVARHEIANIKMLFASCKELDGRLVEHSMMSFYAKRRAGLLPKQINYALVSKSEKVYAIKKRATGFDLFARTSATIFSFHIEQVEHRKLEIAPEFPKCSEATKPFQAAECHALTDFVSSMFGQCKVPEIEEFAVCPVKKTKCETVDAELGSKESPESLIDDDVVCSFFGTFYDMKGGDLQRFDETPNLHLKLSHLFSLPLRYTAKIGLLYVASGQFDQQEILANTEETESRQFRSFLHSIAELVDIGTHVWYDGGLAKSDGPSFFYENEMFEVMYHVSTRLRNDPTDRQRLAKKRHIGNDPVHVVWCENPSGYDPSTITSQYNDCHVVIYPYQENLFRVVVHKKRRDHIFFPLPQDCFVTAEALPLLVAATAVIADTVVRSDVFLPVELFHDACTALTS